MSWGLPWNGSKMSWALSSSSPKMEIPLDMIGASCNAHDACSLVVIFSSQEVAKMQDVCATNASMSKMAILVGVI